MSLYRRAHTPLRLLTACLLFAATLAGSLTSARAERLRSGDVLYVNVFGRDDLTGKYLVQFDRIALPLLGAIAVKNVELIELEQTLATEFGRRLGSAVSLNIEILERAPVYVLGAVNQPGAHAFREQMTALQALAAAGGVERVAARDLRLMIDLMKERERRDDASEKAAAGIAQRARLLAERDGLDQMPPLPMLERLVGEARARELVETQARILRHRIDQHRAEIATLRRRAELGRDEVDAYETQLQQLQEQKQLIERELGRVRELRRTGLGVESRVFDMQQRSSALSADLMGAIAAAARAKTDIGTSETKIREVEQKYAAEIGAELVKVELALKTAEVTIDASGYTLRAAGLDDDEGARPRYRLVRQSDPPGGRFVEPETALEPGDVLEIVVKRRQLRDVTGSISRLQ